MEDTALWATGLLYLHLRISPHLHLLDPIKRDTFPPLCAASVRASLRLTKMEDAQ